MAALINHTHELSTVCTLAVIISVTITIHPRGLVVSWSPKSHYIISSFLIREKKRQFLHLLSLLSSSHRTELLRVGHSPPSQGGVSVVVDPDRQCFVRENQVDALLEGRTSLSRLMLTGKVSGLFKSFRLPKPIVTCSCRLPRPRRMRAYDSVVRLMALS